MRGIFLKEVPFLVKRNPSFLVLDLEETDNTGHRWPRSFGLHPSRGASQLYQSWDRLPLPPAPATRRARLMKRDGI